MCVVGLWSTRRSTSIVEPHIFVVDDVESSSEDIVEAHVGEDATEKGIAFCPFD